MIIELLSIIVHGTLMCGKERDKFKSSGLGSMWLNIFFTSNLIFFRFMTKEIYGPIKKKIKMTENFEIRKKIDTLYFTFLKTIQHLYQATFH